MKRSLLAPVFLAAGCGRAEWVRMGEDSGQVTHLLDPKTIGKDGDLRTVRWLEEFRTKDATGALPTRSMYEFDCQQERRAFYMRRVYCGANLLPQCLHLRASRKTNSRQSGHLTCVSGFGPSETISRFLVTSTKMSPSSGEMKSDRKNQPIPLRPRLWARIPTATENKGQKITYSMTTLFFGKF